MGERLKDEAFCRACLTPTKDLSYDMSHSDTFAVCNVGALVTSPKVNQSVYRSFWSFLLTNRR